MCIVNILLAPTVLKALSPVDLTKFWGKRSVEVTTAFTLSAANSVRNNVWMRLSIYAEGSIIIGLP